MITDTADDTAIPASIPIQGEMPHLTSRIVDVYAPIAKKTEWPKETWPAYPPRMFHPDPIRAYRNISIMMFCGNGFVKRNGNDSRKSPPATIAPIRNLPSHDPETRAPAREVSLVILHSSKQTARSYEHDQEIDGENDNHLVRRIPHETAYHLRESDNDSGHEGPWDRSKSAKRDSHEGREHEYRAHG